MRSSFGDDPFAHVIAAAAAHRDGHGDACGLYPAGADVMRLAAIFARAADAKRILDIGSGFGYSALWLAEAAGPEGRVLGIDRFPQHVAQADEFAAATGLGERVQFRAGEAAAVVRQLDVAFDLIHDDGWFAAEPAYFEAMLGLLRPGGVLTMPNWFLLEDALSARPRRDCSEFAGPDWAATTIAYAQRLAAFPEMAVTVQAARAFVMDAMADIEEELAAGAPHPSAETTKRARLACTFAANACLQAVDSIHNTAGTTASRMYNPLERKLRDAHGCASHRWVAHPLYETIGKLYLGHEPDFEFKGP